MKMTVQITAHNNVLYVLAYGQFSLHTAKQNFVEILDAVMENSSQKVLFEGRAISGEPLVIERFFYSEYVADEVRRRVESDGIKEPAFAYILREPVLDRERFGETVARNRGLRAKAFDNLRQAISWLQLSPHDVEGMPMGM